MRGTWEGIMHDAEGHRAKATLTVEEVFESFDQKSAPHALRSAPAKGSVTFAVAGSEHPGKEQRGAITVGQSDQGGIHMEMQLPDVGLVQFDGRVIEVQHHARAAMIGTYAVLGPRKEAISAGVAIFWNYAEVR